MDDSTTVATAVPDVPAGSSASPERLRRAAHRPATPLSGRYGHPLHALAATIPIGMLIAAFAFDVASKAVEGRPFGRAATWLVAIGVVSGVGAAFFGLLDYLRLVKGTRAKQIATTHLLTMDTALLLFIVSFILRRNDDLQYLNGTPTFAMVLAGVGIAVMVAGAFFGSTLTYTFGVRVVDEDDQRVGYLPTAGLDSDR